METPRVNVAVGCPGAPARVGKVGVLGPNKPPPPKFGLNIAPRVHHAGGVAFTPVFVQAAAPFLIHAATPAQLHATTPAHFQEGNPAYLQSDTFNHAHLCNPAHPQVTLPTATVQVATPVTVSPAVSKTSTVDKTSSSGRSQSAPPHLRTPETSEATSPEASAVAVTAPRMLPIDTTVEESTEITFREAQVLYPGAACVFVGNLPAYEPDHRLAMMVGDAFQKFGPCWTSIGRKIKSDGTPMPNAYVQFALIQNANQAVEFGPELTIAGRQCRVEISKSPRSITASARTGVYTLTKEVENVLGRFGAVESCVPVPGFPVGLKTFVKITYVTYGAFLRARRYAAANVDPTFVLYP